jgi:aryl-alcohol dehydrogenase-like predicted oxidoreductase
MTTVAAGNVEALRRSRPIRSPALRRLHEEELMQQRPIGNRTVSAIGLGEMPLSIEGRPDRRQAIATIHASLDAGVTIIDTADAYSLGVQEHGHGEELVAEALAAYGKATDDVVVATKGGHRRPGDGSWTVHGDPNYVKEACEASLKRLGVDAIGLYQYHRPDPKVPWAESVGALADLLDEGKILMAGVSNATVAQIDEAQQVLGGRLVSVQNQFSPRFRSSEGELAHCEKLGIVFIPWSPMGGIGRAEDIERTYPAFAAVAKEVGASPQQVTLAWMLAKGSRVIPIPGSSRPETAISSAAAADIELTPDQVARLDAD